MTRKELKNANVLENLLQIHGITKPEIIDALLNINRSIFVPQDFIGLEYSDVNFPFGNRFIPNFYAVSYMLEISQIFKSSKVLVVGSNTGYLASVCSLLAKYVVCVEEDEALLEMTKKNVSDFNIDKSDCHKINTFKEFNLPKEMNFDMIFVEGAVDDFPNQWKNIMHKNTCIIGTIRKNNSGQFVCAKLLNNDFIYRQYGVSNLEYLPNMSDTNTFKF